MGGGAGGGGFGGTQGGKITKHGAQRMTERDFTDEDVASTKSGGTVRNQSNGAKAYIKEVSPGKFNVVIEGERGPITVFKGIGQKALDRLAKNYGWR